jgi:hypothetical protein
MGYYGGAAPSNLDSLSGSNAPAAAVPSARGSSDDSSDGMGSFFGLKPPTSINAPDSTMSARSSHGTDFSSLSTFSSFDLGEQIARDTDENYVREMKKTADTAELYDSNMDPQTRAARRSVLRARMDELQRGRAEAKLANEGDDNFRDMGPNMRALHLSMESFRNNQAELHQNIRQVTESMARAEEAQLSRDEAAGLGARAPQPARPRGLQPQLPMSIFAHSLPKGVTGRTKERRESLGIPRIPRQDLSLSEVNIRDPANDSEILFVSPFAGRRNPDDLQRSPVPIPGFDPGLSPVSSSNTSSSRTTIPSLAEMENLVKEFEGEEE